MTMYKYLLDVNTLVALADAEHEHYPSAMNWFDREGYRNWGVCPLTEAGFLRVTTNPVMKSRMRTLDEAISILQLLKSHRSCQYWAMSRNWIESTAPFARRIQGHRQIADAYLLGLAIEHQGALVTFDKGFRHLAGEEFQSNVVVLESQTV